MGCSSSQENPQARMPSTPNPAVAKMADLTPEQIANLSDDEILAIELGSKHFMKKLKEVDTSRDYTIIGMQ